ncbi:hypothetical protein WMY93_034049 [Mugilogobius chulae]|uniref:TNFR-Cys domain-containing protein n=1 Tax=Mugilogobius chulae TaxID=88201 RepID=A0AAW0MRQ9_9GOBI
MGDHMGLSFFLILPLLLLTVRGEYWHRGKLCSDCPAGTRVKTRCSPFFDTSCVPCDSGTYTDQPTDSTECHRCTTCVSGSGLRQKTPCSNTSNSVCELEEGHFCEGGLEEDGSCRRAKKHKHCQPGEYVQQPGSASADTQCAPCPVNTFSDGTECRPHTQCEEGAVIKGRITSQTVCRRRLPTELIVGISVLCAAPVVSGLVAALIIYKRKKNNNSNNVI